MRTRFDEQMEELHVELIKMGSLCEEAIALSVQVLLECSKEQNEEDEEVMQETIDDLRGKVSNLEEEIDSKEYEIETLCMRLLLQQQPVARDLRNISSALKMISDMERIGDQAADIADLTSKGLGHYSQSMIHIDDMAKATVKMVTGSVDAFVKNDLALAKKVIKSDDEVDSLFEKVKTELMDLIYDKQIDAKESLNLLMAAKYFERIGDHAVNIAEWVEYSITGERKK